MPKPNLQPAQATSNQMSWKRFTIGYLILCPLLIIFYLTLPRIIESSLNGAPFSFDAAYQTLTFNYAILLIALALLFGRNGSKLALVLIASLLHFQLFIRIMEIELIKMFGYAFNNTFFNHLTLDSALIGFAQYWLVSIPLILLFIGVTWAMIKIDNKIAGGKKVTVIMLVIISLLGARSIFILQKEMWHGEQQFTLYSAIRAAHKYYKKQEDYSKLIWSPAEVANLKKLGLDPVAVTIPNDFTGPKRNLIVIFVEGLGQGITGMASQEYPNLTPNLDRFARENSFFPNFYNATYPTTLGLVSAHCGAIPNFKNYDFRFKVFAPKRPCFPEILDQAGYKQAFIAGSPIPFGGKEKFLDSKKVKPLGINHILESHPEFAEFRHDWGLYDEYLFRAAFEELQKIRKSPPYYFSALTLNSHPTFYPSESCPEYQGYRGKNKTLERALKSFHCTDIAVGKFLKKLKDEGVMDEAIVAVMGDHQLHGSTPTYNKLYLAISDPEARLEKSLPVVGYTPDFAPTILELLEIQIPEMNLGKSLLSTRKNYPRLVAHGLEVIDNKMHLNVQCESPEEIRKARLEVNLDPIPACAKKKIFMMADNWLE